ncbi:hypothetical protein LY76DRAFT_587566 [Colletotrichum caudatum]|nr:hypothetical protein LY76DRAFT_587566 [Colletotrichum caudatum]
MSTKVLSGYHLLPHPDRFGVDQRPSLLFPRNVVLVFRGFGQCRSHRVSSRSQCHLSEIPRLVDMESKTLSLYIYVQRGERVLPLGGYQAKNAHQQTSYKLHQATGPNPQAQVVQLGTQPQRPTHAPAIVQAFNTHRV